MPLAIAALIVAMVVTAIGGSAFWRPERNARETLELGGATPVRLSTRPAGETISSVLELAAPSVAFLTVPSAGRSGSGVVVHAAGFVVTNAHVVEGVDEVRVAFNDGAEYEGVVYGIDPATDLAVVKIDTDDALTVAPLGDSDTLQVGEFVVALGAPFGLEATATSGIVSGLHRSGLGLARFEDFIVTDAPINRGNSGGPLVNLRGEVVGINTAIIAGEDDAHGLGTFAGVGFAIPVNVMRVVAQRLIGDGGLGTPEGEAASPGEQGIADRGDGARAQTVAMTSDRDAAAPAAWSAPQEAQLDASVAMVQTYDNEGDAMNLGSGFVVDTDSGPVLVTNEHVVAGSGTVRVFFRSGDSHRTAQGRVLVLDPRLDLALVALSNTDGLEPLRLGNAENVAVGQSISAAGVREGEGRLTVADNHGAVTELGVRLPGLASAAMIVATNADIRVGDSGGPLLDASGAVIGVMLARDTAETAAASGARRSYAVMFRLAQEFDDLVLQASEPEFEPGFGPIWPRDPEKPFILVSAVVEGGPAERAGLRTWDRILSFDGEPVTADETVQQAMVRALLRTRPGVITEIGIERATEGGAFEPLTISFVAPQR